MRNKKQLLTDDMEIISPHKSSISSLALDRVNSGRFLLAGSSDATISIYDLSKWGSETHINDNNRNINHKRNRNNITGTNFSSMTTNGRPTSSFRPVARSLKVPAVNHDYDDDNYGAGLLHIPAGHSSSITHVQWYPVDTGAFVSSSSDGCVLLWDTNRVQPVLCVRPFSTSATARRSSSGSTTSWTTSHLQTNTRQHHSLIACGSWNDPTIRLVDVRSGSHSHGLSGHTAGISSVQWNEHMPLTLVSGSVDGCISLWDIRKSGSRACITTLDRDVRPPGIVKAYQFDYSHLRLPSTTTTASNKKSQRRQQNNANKKRNSRITAASARLAPNNYDHLQMKRYTSHNGCVGKLQFVHGGQSLVSVCGTDGEVLIWDLRNSLLQPTKFVTTTTTSSSSSSSTGAGSGGNSTAGTSGGAMMNASTPNRRTASICVENDTHVCNDHAATIWIGRYDTILGYPINDGGGHPKHILKGHLDSISSIEKMEPGNTIISGSRDGMILCWGRRREDEYTNNTYYESNNNIDHLNYHASSNDNSSTRKRQRINQEEDQDNW